VAGSAPPKGRRQPFLSGVYFQAEAFPGAAIVPPVDDTWIWSGTETRWARESSPEWQGIRRRVDRGREAAAAHGRTCGANMRAQRRRRSNLWRPSVGNKGRATDCAWRRRRPRLRCRTSRCSGRSLRKSCLNLEAPSGSEPWYVAHRRATAGRSTDHAAFILEEEESRRGCPPRRGLLRPLGSDRTAWGSCRPCCGYGEVHSHVARRPYAGSSLVRSLGRGPICCEGQLRLDRRAIARRRSFGTLPVDWKMDEGDLAFGGSRPVTGL
jgi:hypothetical protein